MGAGLSCRTLSDHPVRTQVYDYLMRGSISPRPDRGPRAFEVVVSLGSDPATGRRRRRSRMTHGGRREAERVLREMLADVDRADHKIPTTATVGELLDEWLRWAEPRLSPTTMRGHRQQVAHRIAPRLGSIPLAEFAPVHLDRWYTELKDEDLAPASIRRLHAIISKACSQGEKWGWLNRNPAKLATPPPVRRKPLRPPEPDEVSALITAAHEQGDAILAALLRLAAVGGLRRGELCGLRWSKVDLDSGEIVIDTALVDVAGRIVEKDTKTHQSRTVALDQTMLDVLEDRHTAAHAYAAACETEVAADAFVFSRSPDGRIPLRPDQVTAAFRHLRKKANVTCRLHDLRHFMATQLVGAGVDIRTVSARLGHAQTSTTLDIYSHALRARDQVAADTIASVLNP